MHNQPYSSMTDNAQGEVGAPLDYLQNHLVPPMLSVCPSNAKRALSYAAVLPKALDIYRKHQLNRDNPQNTGRDA